MFDRVARGRVEGLRDAQVRRERSHDEGQRGAEDRRARSRDRHEEEEEERAQSLRSVAQPASRDRPEEERERLRDRPDEEHGHERDLQAADREDVERARGHEQVADAARQLREITEEQAGDEAARQRIAEPRRALEKPCASSLQRGHRASADARVSGPEPDDLVGCALEAGSRAAAAPRRTGLRSACEGWRLFAREDRDLLPGRDRAAQKGEARRLAVEAAAIAIASSAAPANRAPRAESDLLRARRLGIRANAGSEARTEDQDPQEDPARDLLPAETSPREPQASAGGGEHEGSGDGDRQGARGSQGGSAEDR